MRGHRDPQPALFFNGSYSSMIPENHKLRRIKALAEQQLERIRPQMDAAYSRNGRPSIPPETLLLSLLVQALFSLSENRFCTELGWNMMYKWFIGLQPDEPAFDRSTFSKNRQRLEEHQLIQAFFDSTVVAMIESEAADIECCSVDGTFIQSLASKKSLKRKDDDTPYDSGKFADRQGEKQSNETHQSRTDPDAILRAKGNGSPALLVHSLSIMVDTQAGGVMAVKVDGADGRCEGRAALEMLDRVQQKLGVKPRRIAADRGYDWSWVILGMEQRGVIPYVAPKLGKPPIACNAGQDARRRNLKRVGSKIHMTLQKLRWKVEGPIGWLKQNAGLGRSRHFERWKLAQTAVMGCAAYNLLRLANIAAA